MSAWAMMRNLIRKRSIEYFLCTLTLLGLVSGCVTTQYTFSPEICYYPTPHYLHSLPSAFPPLSDDEKKCDWGKEFYFGLQFISELDLYRAITCFKRALFLIPDDFKERKLQIEFHVVESYFLGKKYSEAITSYENGSLQDVPLNFPALNELLLILYESYLETQCPEKALRVLCLIESRDLEKANKLTKTYAIESADFPTLIEMAKEDQEINGFLSGYFAFSKSPSKARFLNAILPGAGYAYVGQKGAAITSLLINALFLTAAYQFFDRGYVAAGLITASIETGWYFGGINGAGLAAKEYNEQLFQVHGKEFMMQKKLFPVLMFQYAF